MKPKRRRAWLLSLSDSPDSSWGDVGRFYNCIDNFKSRSEGRIIVDSETWGRIRGGELPAPGDGFAFYHSTRARFPKPDKYRRLPRISLIGSLLDVRFSGRDLKSIQVAVEPRVLATMRNRPILRDTSTKPIFERAGLIPGAVYTLYPIDPNDWLELQTFAKRHSTVT